MTEEEKDLQFNMFHERLIDAPRGDMPEVIFAYPNPDTKCRGGYDSDEDINLCIPTTKYISQASSNKAVRDALDEMFDTFRDNNIFYSSDHVWDAQTLRNNLKSKYEGE